MLILLDHSTPVGLRRRLPGHTVHTAAQLGWERLPDGQLISLAQQAGYELLITCDQGITHQQNPATIRMAMLTLRSNHWGLLRLRIDDIVAAVNDIKPGEHRELDIW